MNLSLLSVSAVVAICSAALMPAQGHSVDKSASLSPQQAWLEFVRTEPGSWQVDWNAATGTPEAIFGSGLRASATPVESLAVARAVAASFIDAQRTLLGLGSSQATELIAQRVSDVWVMVFDQRWRDLPVRGGRVDVRLRTSGHVSMFGAIAVPIPVDFDAGPRIAAARAREIAFAQQLVPLPAPAAKLPLTTLVVWSDIDQPRLAPVHLAWEIAIDGGEDDFVGRVYIDAREGQVLQSISDRHSCGCICGGHGPVPSTAALHAVDVDVADAHDHRDDAGAFGSTSVSGTVNGWVNTSSTPDAALTLVPMPRMRIVLASGPMPGINYYSAADGTWTVLTDPSDTSPIIEFHLAGNRIADVITAQGTELFHSISFPNNSSGNVVTFGASGAGEVDRAQTNVFWHVDDISTWAASELGRTRIALLDALTATVNDPLSCNAFYAANTLTFRSLSATCANTAYKSVIEHEWGHGLDDVYGGISTRDGLSEGNADIVAMFRSGEAEIAPGFFRDGRSPSYLRTGLNTRLFPVAGSVHDMGEVWMGCAWDVRARLIASLGPVAGPDRAEMLVLGSIAGNAMRLRSAVRELFLLDDSDADLCNGTPNYADLAAACDARDIPYPIAPCGLSALAMPFGPGCMGSVGSLVGLSGNAAAVTVGTSAGLPSDGKIGIEFVPMRPLPVTGVAILSRSLLPASTTAFVSILDYDAGDDSPGSLLAGPLAITVGTTDGWYGASFAAPIPPLPPMSRYYLVVDAPAGTIATPIASAGQLFDAYHSSATTGWSGPFRQPFAFRLASPPIPVPHLSTANFAVPGTKLVVQVHSAPPTVVGLVGVGFSSTVWALGPLPFDLGVFGAPGCPVLGSWDESNLLITSSVGSMEIGLDVPVSPWIVGLRAYLQGAILDAPANVFGVTVSNAVMVRVGS